MTALPERTDPDAAPPGDDGRLRTRLAATSRLLWAVAPPLRWAEAESDTVRLSHHGLQLPLSFDSAPGRSARDAHQAAVAHAGAHLVHSEQRFDPQGLKPITMALIGLLEDARIEWLACRELPGLRRLWEPFHAPEPDEGSDFEALMRRLARALLQPDLPDPHPWIAKGRWLFFGAGMPGAAIGAVPADVDGVGQTGLIGDPTTLRRVASLLGNDIGQMRLAFNPKTYRVQPVYRDDHQWLWQPSGAVNGAQSTALDVPALAPDDRSADATSTAPGHSHRRDPAAPAATEAQRMDRPAAQPDARLDTAAPADADAPPAAADVKVHLYPEWDRLIGRSRPQWCSVLDRAADGDLGWHDATPAGDIAPHAAEALRRRALALRPWGPQWGAPATQHLPRQAEGDGFDLDALVDARIAQRIGRRPDERVYQGRERRRCDAVTLCLLDLSASTALPGADTTDSQLDQARIAALAEALADGSPALGDRSTCAVHGFCSNGRHRVHYLRIKDFDEPVDAQVLDRLLRLRSGGSTRLGGALRHATALLLARATPRMNLLVISDGAAHDIDVHDPRYLSEDARRAVREARWHGVAVRCLALDVAHEAGVRWMFGRDGYRFLPPAPT